MPAQGCRALRTLICSRSCQPRERHPSCQPWLYGCCRPAATSHGAEVDRLGRDRGPELQMGPAAGCLGGDEQTNGHPGLRARHPGQIEGVWSEPFHGLHFSAAADEPGVATIEYPVSWMAARGNESCGHVHDAAVLGSRGRMTKYPVSRSSPALTKTDAPYGLQRGVDVEHPFGRVRKAGRIEKMVQHFPRFPNAVKSVLLWRVAENCLSVRKRPCRGRPTCRRVGRGMKCCGRFGSERFLETLLGSLDDSLEFVRD